MICWNLQKYRYLIEKYIYPCPHVSKFKQVFNERFERHDSTCQSNKMCYNFAWCNEKQHEIGASILKYCD
jgi:hypothetical protein